ncbi:MAG: DUF805 domain-containing protein [Bifidobacterium aquikefiri]|uniref:DUF805 domain-containing protein n=1 Tax=Bifidobacterium aquikefiri TaxID=1653207 RepID=UPI0023F1B603|nr:DUF805 domain-containing protein [Bifidobacterium aquikefiri]
MSNPYQNQNFDEDSSSEEQSETPRATPQNSDAPHESGHSASETPQFGDGSPHGESPQYGQNPTSGQYAPSGQFADNQQQGNAEQPEYGQYQYDGQPQSQSQPQYGQYGASQQPQQPQYGQPAQEYLGSEYPNNGYRNNNAYRNTMPGENGQWAPNPQFPQTPPQFDAQGNRFGFNPPIDRPWYGISLKDAIIRFFKKYAVFSGRASRSEYWWAYLFTTVVSLAISIIFSAMGNHIADALSVLWSLAVLVPSIAIAVRRLHDANLSGWWYFLPLALSILGGVIMIVAVVGGVMSAGSAYGSSMGSAMVGRVIASVAVPFILSLLILLGASVSGIVLMCLSSKPEGARFDVNLNPQDAPFMPNQQNLQNPPYAGNTPTQQGQSSDQNPQYPQNPMR